jgi:hypothetical protein
VPPASALRSDVAGFVGRARRGPIGEPVRVEGWRAFERVFGGLRPDLDSPYAVRAYFNNGGEVLYFVRVAETRERVAVQWDLQIAQQVGVVAQTPLHPIYDIAATSPGDWAQQLAFEVRYRRWGGRQSATTPGSWVPDVDVTIAPLGEPVERFDGIVAAQLADEVNRRSAYVRLIPKGLPGNPIDGATALEWALLLSASPLAAAPLDYDAALVALLEQPEVAIMALPDLHGDLPPDEVWPLLRSLLSRADAQLDRMVIIDPPLWAVEHEALPDPNALADLPLRLASWLASLQAPGMRYLRSAALYFPYLDVVDPLGSLAQPLRRVPPSGHVAGVISRLDRDRGAHHSPANARIEGAVGLAGVDPSSEGRLFERGVNLLRCHPRDGLVVWGARTAARDDRDPSAPDYLPAKVAPDGLFIAHRRLIHRLVRAIRRAAEPLVFETNGPLLWLALGRAVTTVLMGAFRAGALQGERVEDAFRIKCDEETNPPDGIDNGRCECRIKIAAAVPMEFIELRIALSRDGALEVIQP